jgi:hypothetical protein
MDWTMGVVRLGNKINQVHQGWAETLSDQPERVIRRMTDYGMQPALSISKGT